MEHRNRKQGWKYAKLTGHANEDVVKEELETNKEFQYHFLNRVNCKDEKISKIIVGSIHENNVASINGNTTKSKTDLKVYLQRNKLINVSIKKSSSGQVYLVRAGIFIDTFERQFNKHIPSAAKRAINLFWSGANDAVEIIDKYADKFDKKNYNMQLRHKSLNATTLKNYDERLYYGLLDWFVDNAYEVAKLSFSMGAALNKNDWSDFVWYINLLGENSIDDIFCIEEICNAAQRVAQEETYFGTKNGGTTVQLPFGSVQWHQNQLEFRHNYKSLCYILC